MRRIDPLFHVKATVFSLHITQISMKRFVGTYFALYLYAYRVFCDFLRKMTAEKGFMFMLEHLLRLRCGRQQVAGQPAVLEGKAGCANLLLRG